MKLALIVAHGLNNQIGLDGGIPFKSDLKRFKYLTLGKTLIMGRKTYESIGYPLGGRQTIVISNKIGFMPENIFIVKTTRKALKLAQILNQDIAVVGGEKVYEAFFPYADRLYITITRYQGPADAYFPNWDGKDWTCSFEEFETDYTFKIYEKIFR